MNRPLHPHWLFGNRRMSLPDFQLFDIWFMGIIIGLSGIFYGLSIKQRFQTGRLLFGVMSDHTWQVIFIASGTTMILGLLLRFHKMTWLGVGVLVTAYTTLTIGLIMDQPERWMYTLSRTMVTITLAGFGWMRLGPVEPDDDDGS